jgi:hypothetical protein
MHYLIVATMRFMLVALILLGLGLFVLMGLLSILRDLFADDDLPQRQPQSSDSNATGGFCHAAE